MSVCLAFSALTVFNFILEHWDLLFTVFGFLLYVVKSTKWGRANAKALQVVAGAIEKLDRVDVKHAIKEHSLDLPKAVVDALDDAVRTVDEKKPTPTGKEIVLRHLGRRKKAEKE